MITAGADELVEDELTARDDELELDEMALLTEELLLIEVGLLLVAADVVTAELDEVVAAELVEFFDPPPPQALSAKQSRKSGSVFWARIFIPYCITL